MSDEIEMQESAAEDKNVDILNLNGREVIIVGTAHVSKSSVELVSKIIQEKKPDTVAVELCESRYNSLKDPNRWRNMDLYSVIKEGKAYVLMAQLALAAFQKKLGDKLEVKPGAEMMEAIKQAENTGAKIALADRDIKTTLKRTWGALGFWSMCKVVVSMFLGVFSDEKFDEADIERLKSSDALEELMQDFTKELPDVRRALIDERDEYLAAKIATCGGNRVVAVVGAGHVPGIKRNIEKDIDIAKLEVIPPTKLITKLIGWAIPLLIVALIVYGFISGGSEEGWSKVWTWAWVTSSTAAIGSIISLAHPLSILAAAISAPITTVHPALASGWFAGLAEAWIRKPRVSDLENVLDIKGVSDFWKNRVTKVLLIIALTNLTGSLGAFLAMYLMAK